MAAQFDVAARLAEGLPAVDDVQTFVSASQLRGYQHPDLTLHDNQIRDWYGTQDGLDLGALDADYSALQSAVEATGEALRIAKAQGAAMREAWTGQGASAAMEFIERHCAEAGVLAAAVAQAASAVAALRDALWSAVDAKVDAAVSIDDRRSAQRPSWLGAARAVIAGVDDREDAGAVVDNEVKPFVEEQIAGDWLEAMRSAISNAASAYRSAVSAIEDGRHTRFAIPGDLGPRYVAAEVPPAPAPAPAPASAASLPANAALDDWFESAALPTNPPLGPAASPPAMPANTMSPLASAPPLPTAMPDFGAAAGIPARLADAVGGLLGSPGTEPLPDPPELPELDPPELPAGPETLDEADDPDDPDGSDTDAPDSPETDDQHELVDAPVVEDVAPEPDVVPESQPVPAVEAPPPPAEATPCEIAADELPHAGE